MHRRVCVDISMHAQSVFVDIRMHAETCMHSHQNACIDVYVFISACMQRRVHVPAKFCLCFRRCLIFCYMYWCTYIGLQGLIYMCWFTYIGLHILVYMYWFTCIRLHVLFYIYWFTYIGLHVLVYIYCLHILVYIHMYWFTYIGLHILVYMYWFFTTFIAACRLMLSSICGRKSALRT
jgi:hypothetical protein